MKTITTPYTLAITYSKRTNLLDFARAQYPLMPAEQMMRQYGVPREVEFILLVRWENNRVYCKAKCPVNPLPIKGEFEVPSINAIERFLVNHEWRFKSKQHIAMLK